MVVGSFFILGIILFFSIYIFFIEPRFYKFRNEIIYSKKIFLKINILHLSDLHLKRKPLWVLKVFLKNIVKKTNGKIDLILITGDFAENEKALTSVKEIVEIFSTIPIYGVIGNHEKYIYSWIHTFKPFVYPPKRKNLEKIISILKDAGVEILKNKIKNIKIKKNKISIYGVEYTDFIDEIPKLDLKKLSFKNFNIFICHSPDILYFLKEKDFKFFDLILTGHTHGGQVSIPGYGPIITRTKFFRHFASGCKKFYNTYLNICKGLGQKHNIRFFCRPEAVLICVIPEKKK